MTGNITVRRHLRRTRKGRVPVKRHKRKKRKKKKQIQVKKGKSETEILRDELEFIEDALETEDLPIGRRVELMNSKERIEERLSEMRGKREPTNERERPLSPELSKKISKIIKERETEKEISEKLEPEKIVSMVEIEVEEYDPFLDRIVKRKKMVPADEEE